ncbi:hypothetical protein OAV05_02015 [Flavobacteriaceae bacterium]|jgi:hypothetical protein|nr:hypothetical protein [Flavobacteriaceae bacterium]
MENNGANTSNRCTTPLLRFFLGTHFFSNLDTTETMKPFTEACYDGLVEIVNSDNVSLMLPQLAALAKKRLSPQFSDVPTL